MITIVNKQFLFFCPIIAHATDYYGKSLFLPASNISFLCHVGNLVSGLVFIRMLYIEPLSRF